MNAQRERLGLWLGRAARPIVEELRRVAASSPSRDLVVLMRASVRSGMS